MPAVRIRARHRRSQPGRFSGTIAHSLSRHTPEFCRNLALEIEGAGKTGCAPHPRSRRLLQKDMLPTSIQVRRRHPAFPAQWLYGLYEIVLVTGFLATIARARL